jgi:hypothetical protein
LLTILERVDPKTFGVNDLPAVAAVSRPVIGSVSEQKFQARHYRVW